MKQLARFATLVAALACIQGVALGHGGQYRGPGDVVPPGGGAQGGGGGGPGGTGPAGPTSAAPGPFVPGGTPRPSDVRDRRGTSQDALLAPDQTLWSFWWGFNKEPYLRLKSHVHEGGVRSGSDGWFLGMGQTAQGNDTLRPTEAQIRETIVPALLATLESESNNDIVTGCLIALAKIGDAKDESGESRLEAVITRTLADPVQEISETAALSLGILANDASVSTLASLLHDDEEGRRLVGAKEVGYRTRAFAAYGLALVGAQTGSEEVRREVVRHLAAVLDSETTSTRDLAVACVVSLGLVPLETLGDPEARARDAAADPGASRSAQLAHLLAYLDEEDNRYLVRAHCPTALARLLADLPEEIREVHRARVAEALLKRLGPHADERNEVVQSCVLALGLLGDADSDPLDAEIRETLREVPRVLKDQQARNYCMIALAKVGGNPGKDGAEAEGIAEAGRFLMRQLTDGKSTVRPWAGLGLGVMGRALADAGVSSPLTVAMGEALRESLASERNDTRLGAYAIGVGIAGDRESQAVLSERLERLNDDLTRGYVAVALGLLNDQTVKDALRAIVRDSTYRPELLKQAAIALGLLEDRTVVPDLIDMLANAKSLATQAAISTALGTIGDWRSVEPLVEMLRDESLTDTARGFAAVALGIVGDKESLPWSSRIAVDLNYRATTQTLNDPTGTAILNIL